MRHVLQPQGSCSPFERGFGARRICLLRVDIGNTTRVPISKSRRRAPVLCHVPPASPDHALVQLRSGAVCLNQRAVSAVNHSFEREWSPQQTQICCIMRDSANSSSFTKLPRRCAQTELRLGCSDVCRLGLAPTDSIISWWSHWCYLEDPAADADGRRREEVLGGARGRGMGSDNTGAARHRWLIGSAVRSSQGNDSSCCKLRAQARPALCTTLGARSWAASPATAQTPAPSHSEDCSRLVQHTCWAHLCPPCQSTRPPG